MGWDAGQTGANRGERHGHAAQPRQDAHFGGDQHSPLGHAERHTVAGLLCYPINPALRLELRLDRAVPSEVVTVETSTEQSQEYQRAGIVYFTVGGQAATLKVYQGAEGELPSRYGMLLLVRKPTAQAATWNPSSWILTGCWWTSSISPTPTAPTTRTGAAPYRREKTGCVPLCAGERTFHAHSE